MTREGNAVLRDDGSLLALVACPDGRLLVRLANAGGASAFVSFELEEAAEIRALIAESEGT